MHNNHSLKNIFVKGAVQPEQIVDSIRAHGSKKSIGGHSIFLGQVRADKKESGVVQAIEYLAYEEMAILKAHQIREEIFKKYDIHCMHIYHSLGVVAAGEICLFVFTSSKSRKPAIDACEEVVERIKKELPIWGKEILDSHDYVWKINHY